jgi:hypothetical protein
MPHYQMCDEHGCPFTGNCARYLAVPDDVQRYRQWPQAGTRACEGFLDADETPGRYRPAALVRLTYAQMIDITPKREKADANDG